MIADNKLLDELAKLASGAASTASGVRNQAEAEMRDRLERLFERADLAKADDLEAVRIMASQAREEQEQLAQRVADLETRLAALESKRSRSGSRSGGNSGKKGSGGTASGSTS